MVYYFTSNQTDPPTNIYVGKDKFENEDLIKYGLEQDVWFHADNLSSAHIYVRMAPGQSWEALPAVLLTDCAQLTKANSIEGNKRDNVGIVYTPWSNLRKDGSMAVGQVSFRSERAVRRLHVAARDNAVVNRLNKTRAERFPDLARERDDALKEERRGEQAARRVRQKEELRVARERKELAWQRDHAYDELHDEGALEGSSNQDRPDDWEDDFM